MMQGFRKTLVAAVGVAGLAGAASAQVPWSNASGAGSFFTWLTGQSGQGFFGNPVLIGGNQFQFSPTQFSANSNNGVAASRSDQLQVVLQANAGQRFTSIRIQEFGTWAITGIGSVQDSGTMFITDLVTPRAPAIQNIVPSPAMPIITAGSGNWSGDVTINLAGIIGPDWTRLQLQFSNTLQATSNPGSTSMIAKALTSGPAVIITILPSPGSLAILAMAGAIVYRRRR